MLRLRDNPEFFYGKSRYIQIRNVFLNLNISDLSQDILFVRLRNHVIIYKKLFLSL
ncbi:hypothetical protein TPENAI_60825 [Tenacibaculum litopenaei]